jgi:transcriptional regulator with XRE-family HTH domain
LTLDELAAQSGVSKAMISRVEGGARSLTLDTASALCDVLGLSLDALAGRKATAGTKNRTIAIAKARRLADELREQIERLD